MRKGNILNIFTVRFGNHQESSCQVESHEIREPKNHVLKPHSHAKVFEWCRFQLLCLKKWGGWSENWGKESIFKGQPSDYLVWASDHPRVLDPRRNGDDHNADKSFPPADRSFMIDLVACATCLLDYCVSRSHCSTNCLLGKRCGPAERDLWQWRLLDLVIWSSDCREYTAPEIELIYALSRHWTRTRHTQFFLWSAE